MVRAAPGPGRRRTMAGRDPGEPHGAATSLELLFDLCFVIAVAQASRSLHAALSDTSC